MCFSLFYNSLNLIYLSSDKTRKGDINLCEIVTGTQPTPNLRMTWPKLEIRKNLLGPSQNLFITTLDYIIIVI